MPCDAPLIPNRHWPPLSGYLLALTSTSAGTWLLAPWRETFDLSNIALLYVLAVVLLAISCGRGPAVFGALLSALDFAYVFVPPHYSLAITEAQYLLSAVIMLVVALAVGHLTSRLKQHADHAERKSQASAALCQLAQALAEANSASAIHRCADQFLAASLHTEQLHIFYPDDLASATQLASPALLRECLDRQSALTRPLGDGRFYLLLPLLAGEQPVGILGFAIAARHLEQAESIQHLETLASMTAVALERVALAARVRAAELKHTAEALRSSLLSALSHDLRTPLTALVGMAETLTLPGISQERQQSMLSALRQQALAISRQMNDLLEMARLSSGAPQLNLAWQPIDEVLGSLCQQAAMHWPQRQLELSLAPDLPPVHIDAVLIERLLWNLLDNACKYSPPDTPVALQVTQAPSQLSLQVCDHGEGISPEAKTRIFDMFQREQRESNRPGLGLGLAIAQSIAQAHGGTLTVSDRPTGGSCFTLRLPLGTPPDLPTGEEAA